MGDAMAAAADESKNERATHDGKESGVAAPLERGAPRPLSHRPAPFSRETFSFSSEATNNTVIIIYLDRKSKKKKTSFILLFLLRFFYNCFLLF